MASRPPRVAAGTCTAADGGRARLGGVWTQEKLSYLRRYTEAFVIAMGAKRRVGVWKQLVFIDPLCGPGIDVDRATHEEFPGSPLIGLAADPAFDRLYLGDASAANVAALHERIPAESAGRVSLTVSDCHQRVQEVVADLDRGSLGMAFIDPEGFEVHFELFQTLAQRPIDIVFLFPSGIGIARNLRQFVESEHCGLDDLWPGWRNESWARLAAADAAVAEMPSDALQQSWVAGFCSRVATLGYVHDVVGPLRNEQGAPMYHLLFFSKSDAGLTIWRNVHLIDPRGQRRLRF